MRNRVASLPSWLMLLLFVLNATAGSAAQSAADVIDKFVTHVKTNSLLSEAVRTEAVAAVERLRMDTTTQNDAIGAGLKVLSPEFAAALQSLSDGKGDEALKQLIPLTTSADVYLAAEANYLAARILVLQERHEEALPKLVELVQQRAGESTRLSEAWFLRGKSEAGMLKRDEALDSLERFLENFPDAPQRQRREAEATLVDLEEAEFDQLSDVHSKMDFSRRRLKLEDTGEKTREVQDNVVALLTEMIDELEKKSGKCKGCKCSGSKPGSGNGGQSPGQSSGTSQPAQITERDGTRTPWVDLKNRADDPTTFNAAKKRLPAQYKDLVQQYYSSFQNDGGNSKK